MPVFVLYVYDTVWKAAVSLFLRSRVHSRIKPGVQRVVQATRLGRVDRDLPRTAQEPLVVMRRHRGRAGPLGSKTPPLEISFPNKRLSGPSPRLSSGPTRRGRRTSELRNGDLLSLGRSLPRKQQGALCLAVMPAHGPPPGSMPLSEELLPFSGQATKRLPSAEQLALSH